MIVYPTIEKLWGEKSKRAFLSVLINPERSAKTTVPDQYQYACLEVSKLNIPDRHDTRLIHRKNFNNPEYASVIDCRYFNEQQFKSGTKIN